MSQVPKPCGVESVLPGPAETAECSHAGLPAPWGGGTKHLLQSSSRHAYGDTCTLLSPSCHVMLLDNKAFPPDCTCTVYPLCIEAAVRGRCV